MKINDRPTIGIRLPVRSGTTHAIVDGVIDYMTKHGLWRVVTNQAAAGLEPEQIGIGWEGDGVIVDHASDAELRDFKRRNIAVVIVGASGPDDGFPRVLPNHRGAGAIAANHLIDLGLKSFAFLTSSPSAPNDELLDGFEKVLANADWTPTIRQVTHTGEGESSSWKQQEDELTEFVHALPSRTGLFVTNDALAAAVLRAAEKADKDVPNDLSVIGFGNDPNFCHASIPALSSIPVSGRAIGFSAANQIARQLSRRRLKISSQRVSVGSVIARESTDFIAIDDPETVRLVRWIRVHAPHEALHVGDLEAFSDFSLSSIKDRFRKLVGHSPKDEIKRVRLNHLTTMLRDTSLTFDEISDAMRFISPHEMSRFFHRETGERPSVFRERHREK